MACCAWPSRPRNPFFGSSALAEDRAVRRAKPIQAGRAGLRLCSVKRPVGGRPSASHGRSRCGVWHPGLGAEAAAGTEGSDGDAELCHCKLGVLKWGGQGVRQLGQVMHSCAVRNRPLKLKS